MKLDLPAAETIAEHKKGLSLFVTKDGRIYVDKTELSIKGIQPLVRRELEKAKNLQVLFHADKDTPYELVIDVLDRVRLAGCYDIVLKVQKK